jgi:uncharacterized membrane protein YfcA
MNKFIIEMILGLICGVFLGITGIAPTGLVILALDYFQINNYITNLGTILFINLFPLSIGSVWEFYKEKKVDLKMGIILFLSIVLGGFVGSKFVLNKDYKLSKKTIKYITSILGLVIFISFLISAQYEEF